MVKAAAAATAGSTATRSRSSTSSRSSAPAPTSSSPTSRASVAELLLGATVSAHDRRGSTRAQARASRAASTRRCGRSASVGGDAVLRRARARAPYLVDTDGNRYLDYVQSWGASILGHAHPAVVEAVQRAAADGHVVRRADRARGRARRGDRASACRRSRRCGWCRRAPRPAMTAVRLARGATGRSKILKFAGCYHGHLDALLVAAGSGVATLGLPGSAGVTEGTVADTIVVPYNDAAALDAAFAEHGTDLAAVLVEPVAANMGLVPPAPRLPRAPARPLHRRTARCSCSTRSSPASASASAARRARSASRPTSRSSARSSAAGCRSPRSAAAPTVMDELAPLGPVYQAGTLSGNPLATAAGPRRARRSSTTTSYDDARRQARARLADRARATRSPTPACPRRSPRPRTLAGLFFADRAGHELRRRAAGRPRALRAVLPRHARPWRVPRAERLRDDVREPRPHRRRHRPPRSPRPPTSRPASEPHAGRGRNRWRRRATSCTRRAASRPVRSRW